MRSRSRSPGYRGGGRRRRSSSRGRRSASPAGTGEHRLHLADIGSDVTERMLEDVFKQYGKLNEIWLASYPPWYAFINFKYKEDADRALKDTDGNYLGMNRIRVTMARPRGSARVGRDDYGGGGGGRGYDDYGGRGGGGYGGGGGRDWSNVRCYNCNEMGHTQRSCRGGPGGGYGGGGGGGYGGGGGGGRRRSRSNTWSPPRRSGGRRSESRSRSRSPQPRRSNRSRSHSH